MMVAIDARKSTEQTGVSEEEKSVGRQVESAKAYASEQEICDILRQELGTYTDPAEF